MKNIFILLITAVFILISSCISSPGNSTAGSSSGISGSSSPGSSYSDSSAGSYSVYSRNSSVSSSSGINNLTAQFKISTNDTNPFKSIVFDAGITKDSVYSNNQLLYKWDFENDGEYDTGYSQQYIITNAFYSTGLKSVKLTVRNPAGIESSVTDNINISQYGTPVSMYKSGSGIWIWKTNNLSDLFDDMEKLSTLFDWCCNKGINEIYLDISYINLHTNILRNILSAAHESDIKIYALMGDPRWSLSGYYNDAYLNISNIINFNNISSAGERFDGIHFDVEPWTLDGQNIPGFSQWVNDTSNVCRQYLQLLSNCQYMIKNQNMKFIEDITFWFDDTTDYPVITNFYWNNKNQSLANHIIDSINEVAIMTVHSNYAWIIDRVRNEMSYAESKKKPVMIIFQLYDSLNGSFSYCFKSDNDLNNALYQINLFFNTNSSFIGPGIHSYNDWLLLP